jgi:hypothetical protein
MNAIEHSDGAAITPGSAFMTIDFRLGAIETSGSRGLPPHLKPHPKVCRLTT